MDVLLKIIGCALVLAGGFFFTHRVVPWLFVKAGRLLGFRMRFTPLTERRVRRFRSIRRGYVCFLIITTAFVTSLFLELTVNRKPLYVSWGDHWQMPAVADWANGWIPFVTFNDTARKEDYGLEGQGELDYRRFAELISDPQVLEREAKGIEKRIVEDEKAWRTQMARIARENGEEWDPDTPLSETKRAEYEKMRTEAARLPALLPKFGSGKGGIVQTLHPYSANEQLLHLPGSPPHRAFADGIPGLGTDFSGRDIIAQLLYGFRISFSFAVTVAFIGFSIGIAVGAIMGYFGGWVDILVQRFIEVWSSVPFLFTMMILASLIVPGFFVLALMLVLLRAWLGITYTVRGEFYREKARDYVQAAKSIGVSNPVIMAKHILPNSLVPVVTFLPFRIVQFIGALVSLDFLGFGLPPGTPSWGNLLSQGAENVMNYPELVWYTVGALAFTLFCVVMVGEAVREAFDPKKYSRLR